MQVLEKELPERNIISVTDCWNPIIEPANAQEIAMIDERMKDYEDDPSSFSPLKH